MSEQLAQQNEELETAAVNMNEAGRKAPEELAPAVEQLTATLQAVKDPKTPPQEREEVTEIAQRVISALAVIGDPESRRELREELTVIVLQVASAVHRSLDPHVPPELRTTAISTMARASSALGVIGAPETPPELRRELILIMKPLTATLASDSPGAKNPSNSPGARNQPARPTQDVAGAVETISDPKTPPEQRLKLAKITAQAASSLPKLGDPAGSRDDRAKARQVFRQQTAEMKKRKEKAVSAQGMPDAPLDEAAEVCTNAIFTAVSDRALGRSLKDLLPSEWQIEGVRDFWKAQEGEDDFLDVIARLRNGDDAGAPFDVGKLTTRLAQLVPANELFGALGAPGLHCLQAAWHLDRAGIAAGTWVEMALEKKGNG
ncbi:hypothetical protein ACIQ7Q_30830 [Streptomyces sp. NPDC096176]|uniref:hypothetical protein n=1 Tax=Streptomyces sp. NPDC096176 TaxID=3366079 RepID=UPI00381B6EB6